MSAPAEAARRTWVVAFSVTAVLLYTIDSTVANIALPYLQGSLQASQEQAAWVLTSYLVASAVCTPLAGFLANRLGLARVLVASVALFTLASVLCGLATSLGEMVVFRAIQGGAGAALVPLTQVVLLRVYPPALHGRANALWGMGVLVGPILGPTLGGWLTEYHGWRWAFLINLPVGALAVFGLLATLPKDPPDPSRKLDLTGFAWLALAVGLFQLALDRGHGQGWLESREIVLEFALSGLALYLFIAHSLTTAQPFFPRPLFRDRNFMVAVLVGAFMGVLIITPAALVPQYLQQVQGYSVLEAGVIVAARGAGAIVTTFWIGQVQSRLDPRLTLSTGLVTMAVSFWMFSGLTPDTSAHAIELALVVQGAGLSMLFMPVMQLAFATLPPALRTDAGAATALWRNVGSSLGLSWMFSTIVDSAQVNHAYLAEQLGQFDTTGWVGAGPALEAVAARGIGSGEDAVSAAAALGPEMARQAASIAYDNAFALLGVASLCALPLVALMRSPKRGGGPAPAPAPDAH